MAADLIGIIEAAYSVEQSEEQWLNGLLSVAGATIEGGLGVSAFTYDASDPAAFRMQTFVTQGIPSELAELAKKGIPSASADWIRASFLSLSCGTSSAIPGWYEQPGVSEAIASGINDSLVINGVNPGGRGCALLAPLPKRTRLRARQRFVLERISCHLAAAYRLRLSLAAGVGAPQAEAILDSDGKVQHAEGAACSQTSRTHLSNSARAIARAQSPLRTSAPDEAVAEWKGLIAARWTLVDVCESDGRRYLLAKRNEMGTAGPAPLTCRESQVVALAALGQHNKLISYNLGLSHSTVRVLMARAAAKLGAGSRAALIGAYVRHHGGDEE